MSFRKELVLVKRPKLTLINIFMFYGYTIILRSMLWFIVYQ